MRAASMSTNLDPGCEIAMLRAFEATGSRTGARTVLVRCAKMPMDGSAGKTARQQFRHGNHLMLPPR
jgi:hypothetical protein